MKYVVGIDFGIKRTGIALSDSNQIIASPHDTVDSSGLINYLKKLYIQYNFDTLVLGYPKKLNGSDSDISQNVRELEIILKLEFTNVKIELFDERFTSKIASKVIHQLNGKKSQKRKKELIDKISASIILQDYINQKNIS